MDRFQAVSFHREKSKANACRIAFVFVLLALGIIASVVYIGTPNTARNALLVEHSLPVSYGFSKLQEYDSGLVSQPTQADVEPFSENALKVLTELNFWSQVDNSDLPESCGLSQFPCVDKIGSCLLGNLVKNANGQLTPKTQACSCFTKGYQEQIPIPGRPDLSIGCPFHCAESILKVAHRYLAGANGPRGPRLRCKSLMSALASEDFGNRNGAIATDGDLDSMGVLPVDVPGVAEAADAVRVLVNRGRQRACPALPALPGPPEVVYAKRGLASEGREEYRLELLLGGREVFFARVARLPRDRQLVDPAAAVALNDTADLLGRYRAMRLVPEPCANAVEQQIAVSRTGEPSALPARRGPPLPSRPAPAPRAPPPNPSLPAGIPALCPELCPRRALGPGLAPGAGRPPAPRRRAGLVSLVRGCAAPGRRSPATPTQGDGISRSGSPGALLRRLDGRQHGSGQRGGAGWEKGCVCGGENGRDTRAPTQTRTRE